MECRDYTDEAIQEAIIQTRNSREFCLLEGLTPTDRRFDLIQMTMRSLQLHNKRTIYCTRLRIGRLLTELDSGTKDMVPIFPLCTGTVCRLNQDEVSMGSSLSYNGAYSEGVMV